MAMNIKSNFVSSAVVRIMASVMMVALTLSVEIMAQDGLYEVATDSLTASEAQQDSVKATVWTADEAIRGIAEYRFTPPPMAPAIGMYGIFDSIRTDFINVASLPAPTSPGPFDSVDGSTLLAGWHNGGVVAFGSMQNMPGLMGIESGGLQMVQSFGNLTVGLGGSASKYGYFNGLRSNYGLHGSVQWRFNDVLSLRVFGSYYTNNAFTSAATAGYMGTDSYGAVLRIDASDNWGVDLGARRVYNSMSGRWETVPVARPYLKINGREAISIDAGGLLHEFLRSKIYPQKNPTFAPPIQQGYAPVRPHEDW